jgi:hypothetical protein
LARRKANAGEVTTEPVELAPTQPEAGVLHVVLPDELTATAGKIEVTVVNPLPGGGRSTSLIVTVE